MGVRGLNQNDGVGLPVGIFGGRGERDESLCVAEVAACKLSQSMASNITGKHKCLGPGRRWWVPAPPPSILTSHLSCCLGFTPECIYAAFAVT